MGVDFELVNFCEFDKYAVKSYCAIHGVDESKNLGDITKVDANLLPKDIDILTYGFPCQDISLAGKQKGLFNEDGTKTRSGLFFEALRIIEATKPKVCIAENVKNLTSKKFKNQFQIVLQSLAEAGYYNYYKVLNAKDYGIPQNWERVFIVSIRKDIDNGIFEFPIPFELKHRLKDILDDEVDEKFYISDARIKGMIQHKQRHKESGNGFGAVVNDPNETDVSPCIRARYYKDGSESLVAIKQIGNVCPTKTRQNPNQGRVYDTDYIGPSLNCMGGGNREPLVLIPQATKQGFIECAVGGVADLSYPNSKTRRGRVQEGGMVSPTLTAESNGVCVIDPSYRIRKLTPKECFRLMGFDDTDFQKAEAVNSNSQLYKQAGNSIVVNVLEHLFENLFDTIPNILNKEN